MRIEVTGGELSGALRASWLPKITNGWFFRAESFLFRRAISRRGSGARRADFLSYSHGEGFMRFFEERCQRQGLFIFDEPESALSPARQMEFLKLMCRMEQSTICQVIMATHSPMLMAYPGARLLRLTKYGLEPVTVEQTDHYRVTREFCADPRGVCGSGRSRNGRLIAGRGISSDQPRGALQSSRARVNAEAMPAQRSWAT